MAKITVLGSGGWGMALSMVAEANGHDVTVWTPFKEECDALIKNHGNEKLLPGIEFPDTIKVTTDINEAEGSLKTIRGSKLRYSYLCCKGL